VSACSTNGPTFVTLAQVSPRIRILKVSAANQTAWISRHFRK
jgi:hypothetical protein